MADEDHLFQKLILEAVQACGSDVECVEAYYESRKGKMSPKQQENLQRDIDRILSFREPEQVPFKDH